MDRAYPDPYIKAVFGAILNQAEMNFNTRKVLIRLQQDDTTSDTLSCRIQEFCSQRNIANYLLTKDGYLLLVSDKKIRLNDGMNTLSKCLSLTDAPTRVTDIDPLPEKFMQDYFKNGYVPNRIRLKFGKVFEDAAIKKTVDPRPHLPKECDLQVKVRAL